MNQVNSTYLNGLRTYIFPSQKALVEYVLNEKKCLVAINAEKILHADEKIREMINSNIGYSDGVGAVWALKRKGFKDAVKIPGCELWLDIIRSSYYDKSFYLIGGSQEVIENTVAKLKNEFPGIKIPNFRNGYNLNDVEMFELANDIRAKKPDVVFIATGSPKQELLMKEMQKFHTSIYLGLGGSLEIYVGTANRAPDWMVKNNLEWAYRLVKQPTRIKRQVHLVRFLWLLFANKI